MKNKFFERLATYFDMLLKYVPVDAVKIGLGSETSSDGPYGSYKVVVDYKYREVLKENAILTKITLMSDQDVCRFGYRIFSVDFFGTFHAPDKPFITFTEFLDFNPWYTTKRYNIDEINKSLSEYFDLFFSVIPTEDTYIYYNPQDMYCMCHLYIPKNKKKLLYDNKESMSKFFDMFSKNYDKFGRCIFNFFTDYDMPSGKYVCEFSDFIKTHTWYTPKSASEKEESIELFSMNDFAYPCVTYVSRKTGVKIDDILTKELWKRVPFDMNVAKKGDIVIWVKDKQHFPSCLSMRGTSIFTTWLDYSLHYGYYEGEGMVSHFTDDNGIPMNIRLLNLHDESTSKPHYILKRK